MIWLLIQLLTTAMMAAIIWLIQILHYPIFYYVDKNLFSDFHVFHSKQISYIVMPLMLIELFTAAIVTYIFNFNILLLINLLLVLVIWLITFYISVPIHNHLSTEKNEQKTKQLIQTNWLRTFFWSLRLLILIVYLYYYVA